MSETATRLVQPFDQNKALFLEDGDGLAAVARTSESTDRIVSEEFHQAFPEATESGIALLAVGGYGRRELFPYSDVDLLFLCGRDSHAETRLQPISRLLARLWDAGLRVSHSVHTPLECTRRAPDNAELHISLLDTRFLAGSASLARELTQVQLPRFFQRTRKELLRDLISLAKARHARYGGTIYHLEPDVKEAPGGLRDFHLACWMSQLAEAGAGALRGCEQSLPRDSKADLLEARRFLFALRCYLHYLHRRDNNTLTFDFQEEIAELGAAKSFRETAGAAEWMRDYFRHVRAVHRLAVRLMDEPAADLSTMLSLYRDYQSRLSNPDFVVARGKVYLRNPKTLAVQPELAYRLFVFVARHGVPLARDTETRLQDALDAIKAWPPGGLWPLVAEILRLPHAYQALTAMHETNVLLALFPELEQIDNLVIRDFYHRYTVDEHTLVAIQTLHDLAASEQPRTQQFARLFAEIETPERLHFALLFHDLGKGTPGPAHAERSIAFANQAMERLQLAEQDREFVRFLIRHHLVISDIITSRDLSEPQTVQDFAELAQTVERLKALALMTYADTSAVHPKALTPWRAELMWRLYTATHNQLMREAGDRRIHVEPTEPFLDMAASQEEKAELAEFLEGLPERYRHTRSPEEVYSHFQLSRELSEKKAALQIERKHSLHEVVVLTWDRPFLFASLCATFSSFGLNIEKAEAYSNQKRMVLDSFVLSDPRRTLELNPIEITRLRRALSRLAEDTAEAPLPPGERRVWMGTRHRSQVEARVAYDNDISRATIFHVTAEDRRGLLFDLASKFSQHECDIQVVLIDTQGHQAIDVFYVVGPEGKLSIDRCKPLQQELLEVCRRRLT